VDWRALIVAGTVWAEKKQEKTKRKRRSGRREYNNALKDRTATVISAESPHVTASSRRVGCSMLPRSQRRKDEFKHLVCVHAAREDGIEEVYINGVALGTLDADGYRRAVFITIQKKSAFND